MSDMREVEQAKHAALNELLSSWHSWQAPYSQGRGYPGTAAGMEQYRASRQYDDENGALDAQLHSQTMRTVGFEVWQMVSPWRDAILINARNLALGMTVFRSPRLPDCDMRRAEILVEARDKLALRLEKAGLL